MAKTFALHKGYVPITPELGIKRPRGRALIPLGVSGSMKKLSRNYAQALTCFIFM